MTLNPTNQPRPTQAAPESFVLLWHHQTLALQSTTNPPQPEASRSPRTPRHHEVLAIQGTTKPLQSKASQSPRSPRPHKTLATRGPLGACTLPDWERAPPRLRACPLLNRERALPPSSLRSPSTSTPPWPFRRTDPGFPDGDASRPRQMLECVLKVFPCKKLGFYKI